MHDVPPRRSLESLRKEAKRWLAALHAGDPDARARLERALSDAPGGLDARRTPTLRDVQHALAREHGAPGWSALTERVSAAGAAESLAGYETMARALLEAFRTGTPEAMERHWRHTWHRRAWRAMRAYVQLDLGRPAGTDADITLDDARWLVAREHGFQDWTALAREVAAAPHGTRHLARAIAVAQRADDGAPDADARDVWSSRDWDRVLQQLGDPQAAGIDAHGQMTDAMLREVAGFPHLTTLRLAGSQALSDEALPLLARMERLAHLDLSGTALTDAGLAALAALPALRSLSLADTRVSDAGVQRLHGRLSARLQRVDLRGTACGDGAIHAFTGLPALRHLASGSAVTEAGIAALHDYPVFRRWQGDTPQDGLTTYEAEPNSLFLRGTFGRRGLARLRGLDGLYALNIDDPRLGLDGDALAPLADLPRLGWLACDASDDVMPYIARMPVLRFLGCQDTSATDDGWRALGASRSIEKIWGRRCYGLADRGFAALSRMPRLTSLAVSCRNVSDAALASLPAFPALRELMPMDIPDAGYRHIARCGALESLVLMYCRDTTDAATEHVVRLPRLARYFASYTGITDRTPELLAEMVSLEQVTFDGCAGVTNAGIAALARLPRLRQLRVSGQRITPDVAAAFPPGVTVQYTT